MGFDNDCIINIQSLAGEYFCPVCRLLVYPNEALQSQCTHLYCKPCLTYIVSTTRACPYDGYLVAEADSKPLTESNKALAETIGKILVHCLYHRSGCTWQGPLSECTSHCSSCTFGNSPVVCNRCGVQIVHRQVQEHAQSCPGVQAQMPQADGAKETANTATVAASDQNPASTQVSAATPQTQPSQSTAAPKSDPKLQASSNSQAQAVAQASAPTHEQWYQQQQYQQYYQQYAGYDPYQQHYQQYYPYQQQGVAQQQQQHLQGHPAQAVQQQPQTYLQSPIQPQSQPQVHLQPQTQPPTHVQTQGASQTHSHTQVNQQQQNHSTVQPHFHKSQTQPLPQGSQNSQPQPQGQPQSVQQAQVPQYQQPYSQTQQSQSQSVNPLHQSQPHPFNQPQPHLHAQSQPHPQAPSQPQPHPQAQPQPQAQNQFQLQTQPKPQTQPIQPMNPSVQPPAQNTSGPAVTGYHSYPQMQSQAHFYPPLQHVTSHQHPVPVPPQGGLQQQSQFPQPPQMRPPQSHAPLYQQQQAMPLHGQAPNIPSQHQSVQSHLQNTGHHVQQHPAMPVGQPPSQQYVQQQPFAGQPSGQQQSHFVQQPMHSHLRPQAPSHSLQQQQVYPQAQQHGMQPHLSQNLGGRPVMSNQVQSQAYLQASGGSAAAVQARATQLGTEGSKVESDIVAGSDSKSDVDNTKSIKSESVSQTKGEETNPVGEVENKSIHGGASTKNISDSEIHVKENGDALCNQAVKEEPSFHTLEQSSCGRSGEVSLEERYVAHDKEMQDQKKANLQNVATSQPPTSLGAPTLQHRPSAPSMLQAPPTGMPQHKQVPGHPPDQHRLQGSVHLHSGQQFSPRGPQFSQEAFDQGNAGPFKPSQNEPLGGRGPVADGMMVRPRGPDGYMGPHLPIHPMEPATYANQRPNYMDGRQPDLQLPGSSGQGIYGQTVRNDRFKPFPDERMNPFSMDPARRDFDNDLKKFPRPSHLGNDPGPQIGSSFPSSRPLDGVPHGFGDVVPRSLDRGHMGGHYYDNRPAPGPMLNPYRHGVNEAGERHIALREDIRPDLVHPNFHGSNPGYSRHHIDGLPPRSPPRDYPGISTHGFGGFRGGPRRGFGLEEMDARDPFYESRFPPLHSHLHRGEFDGPGNLRTGEHFRSGDFPHDTLRRGEYISQHNLRMGGPVGFEDFPVRSPMGGMPGFQNFARHPRPPGEFFGGTRHNYPKIGEPGFRSGFMLQGDVEPFENPRKRKPTSMGWCRICKVDCETVDGLDIHSQTREHQKMAMDMVRDIKQNAKKHKLKPGELSSNEETGRSRNPNSEAHEIKS